MALTPEQIQAQGYTILTDPNQIKDFKIIGQSGKGKGAFLYGTPKDSSSLKGTMVEQTPAQPTIPQMPDNRQLPGQGSIAAFQDVLKQLSYQTLQQNKPSVSDVVNQYLGKGVNLVNPQAIENAYSQQADLYARPIGDIYQSTMAAMQEVEKTKQEKFNTIAQDIFKSAPGFISSLSGEEFDQFKNLQFTPEMQVKLKQAQDLARQQDNKFQFVPTTENQPGGAFDPQTGKFTPSSPTPGPTSNEGSISFRTNNPGNIKWTGADWQKKLGAVDSGIQATDGGSFAKFPSVEAGTDAQKQLLTGSGYANLTLDAAMKRWSNNGYGANVSPTIPADTKIKDLKPEQLSTLMEDMKKREGFTAPSQTGQTNEQSIAQTIFDGTGSLSGVSTKNNLRAKVGTELEKLKKAAIASGDTVGMMRASAGGQNMSDTAVTALEKAVNVVGQIAELKVSVNKEATGPIWGIVRSNNPYDTKAQLIKAQLTSIVPNLARGVYGEVGVLTDNDVALYAKTLPNLKSTEEVSKLVLAATVRSVQRSIESKMLIQAGAGRDVSGLVGEYLKVKNLADSLLPEGQTQQSQNDPLGLGILNDPLNLGI